VQEPQTNFECGSGVGFEIARTGWAFFIFNMYTSDVTKIQNEERGTSPRIFFLEIFCCEVLAKQKKNERAGLYYTWANPLTPSYRIYMGVSAPANGDVTKFTHLSVT
jgi:hypothetical protein